MLWCTGLVQRSDLNGRLRIILNPAPDCGRYHLRLEDTFEHLKMKPANFTKIIACPSEVVDVEADEEESNRHQFYPARTMRRVHGYTSD